MNGPRKSNDGRMGWYDWRCEREESPSTGIFTIEEIHGNIFKITTISDRDNLEANDLLIKPSRVMVLGCRSARYKWSHTPTPPSPMNPLRPLQSTAQNFHQAATDPPPPTASHTQTYTHTNAHIQKEFSSTISAVCTSTIQPCLYVHLYIQ